MKLHIFMIKHNLLVHELIIAVFLRTPSSDPDYISLMFGLLLHKHPTRYTSC